ncbi:MAG: helix-turn-helix transcriptional regulator [Clostridia bacterium]|nr:helix-turn-helix transcriptional regulator [Clostridia bacterium]
MHKLTLNVFPENFKPLPIIFHSASAYFKQATADYKPGAQDFYQILMIVEGAGTLYYQNETYKLKKGSAFFTAMNVPSKYVNEGGLVTAFLTIIGDGIPQMLEYFGCKDFLFYDSVNIDHYISLINQIIDEYYERKCESTLSALSYTFYTTFFEHRNETPLTSLDKTVLYIEKNFAEKLTLDELAEINQTSVSKLCHDFKTQYGCTVFQHILDLRLKYAYNLLNSGRNFKIKDVSIACGFDDTSYFCRAYKNKFGVTPSKKSST